MAASFKKTAISTFPRVGEKTTTDTVYWKSLQFPVTQKEYGAVTYIDFSPVKPYDFAVTASSKVQVFSSQSNQAEKTFTRFRQAAHCGSFRSDGRLLVAGGDEGHVKLFDVAGKSLLRVFKGHTGSVHVTKFTSDNLHLMSGGDDKTLRIFDVPSETEVSNFQEHQDYIRCGVASSSSKDIILTGSYDHTVKLYDLRTSGSVLTVDHGQPVESVLMFPGGGIFLSAGGNVVKVWDALAGGRHLASFSNHHKTITCLAFCSNYHRLLSASLDRHVKIYDVSTYQVVHTLDYPSAVLSVGVAADDSMLVVGMADGLLSMQHRKETPQTESKKQKRQERKASYRYMMVGQEYAAKHYKPGKDDHVVAYREDWEDMTKFDRHLRKFDHTKALDAALELRLRMKTPEVTVSVMQELIRRGGIRTALAGRDDKSLAVVLTFLQKNIGNPKFMNTLLDVANMVIDLYSAELGQSSSTAALLLKLKDTIDSEVAYMKQLLEVLGTMDTLFSVSEQPTVSDTAQTELRAGQPQAGQSALLS